MSDQMPEKSPEKRASNLERIVGPFLDWCCYVFFMAVPLRWYGAESRVGMAIIPRAGAHDFTWADGNDVLCGECGKKIRSRHHLGFFEGSLAVCWKCTAETEQQWEDFQKADDFLSGKKHGRQFPQDFV